MRSLLRAEACQADATGATWRFLIEVEVTADDAGAARGRRAGKMPAFNGAFLAPDQARSDGDVSD